MALLPMARRRAACGVRPCARTAREQLQPHVLASRRSASRAVMMAALRSTAQHCATLRCVVCMCAQDVHQQGGYGSVGYGYSWKKAEAEKNLLRTHTTAVSSRMVRAWARAVSRARQPPVAPLCRCPLLCLPCPQLYQLAQDGFRPAKYFSIDRVFRNEAIDRTHLAEFHQVREQTDARHG